MFRTIWSGIGKDRDYPARQFTLDLYARVLDGALYDHIPQPFHQERTDAGDYVPIRQRRPSVRYNLCRVVVDDAVGLVFSEGHFPAPSSEDAQARAALARIVRGAGLQGVMLEAATLGSVGSAAIQMRVLKAAGAGAYGLFFEPRCTQYLTPRFEPACPDRLLEIVERYKVRGEDLDPAYGLAPDRMKATYWFQRRWDGEAETWFWPQPVEDAARGEPPRIDETRSVRHGLGFTPWVWVRNLPGKLRLIDAAPGAGAYSEVDGACTFAAAIEAMIEVDYQLSQAGRGLKYSMDPTLVIKEPAAPADEAQTLVKGPASAIVLDAAGDAKMLEIGGEAFTVVLDYVRALREFGLESIHGNRAEPQKLAAAQSGRAMELMNQTLIWLADRLRVSYGEGALRALLRMALAANARFPIALGGEPLGPVDPAAPVSLIWPDWYPPTPADRQADAGALATLAAAGLISRETAVGSLAGDYDIEDVAAELERIGAAAAGT